MVGTGASYSLNPIANPSLGPIVRIGPNQYSIDDPAAAKIIYGHSSKFYKVGLGSATSPSSWSERLADHE